MPARVGLALSLLAVACGGGGTDPEPVERSSVQKQCDSLMTTWCDNALACVQDGLPLEERLTDDELAVERQFCIDRAKGTCDATGGVGERFDECQSDVETLPADECDAIRTAVELGDDVAMPATCEAVFTSG